MSRKIAIHVGPMGETADLSQPGKLLLFQKEQDAWKIYREQSFTLNQGKGLRETRKQMTELLESLQECKVFVAGSITGVPYYELERAGFSVWEISGKPADFLDHVLFKEEEADAAVDLTPTIELPVATELGDGKFHISIKEIQESDAGVTSKQILLPLLRRAGWYQFEVLCNHIPPWIEAEAIMGSIVCETKRIAPGEVLLVLSKKVCEA